MVRDGGSSPAAQRRVGRALRIGHFSNAYHPVISGVVNSLDGIRRGLMRSGHTPFIFAPKMRDYRDEHAGVFRFGSVEMTRKLGFPIPIPFSARLFRTILKMKLDLIHSHHPVLLGSVAASFSRKKNIPLVYTFHTQLEEYTHYIPLNQTMVKEMARQTMTNYLSKCDLVICPSSSIRQLIDSYGVNTEVVTLPNAIDTSRFSENKDSDRASFRGKHGIEAKTVVSLSVGRLAKEKNLEFLLKSFRKTCDMSPHCRQVLMIVGDGVQEPKLLSLARSLDIESQVKFLGAVPYSEMPKIYQACDLFTICSTTEVKPLVVLEALASGLPVLAVSACGTVDTLTHLHDGILSELDPQQFSAHWLALTQSSELRLKLAQQTRQTAAAYSLENYTDRLIELYRRALEIRSHRDRRSIPPHRDAI